MPRVISCGFIIRSKNGQYLLGKASHTREDSWTFFKGQQEDGESFIETAIRELKEESGIDINSFPSLKDNLTDDPFFSFRLSKKTVFLFLLEDHDGVLDDYEFCCSSVYGESILEIVDFKWFDLDEMESFLFNSQKQVVTKIKEKYEDRKIE